MEVISDFSAPLALSAIADLIGVPQQDHARFQQWSDELAAVAEAGPEMRRIARAHASLYEVKEYFQELLAQRRRHHKDDFLSGLLRAEARGDHLVDSEIIAISMLVLLAGHDTTTHLLANSILALLQNPDQLDRLRANPPLMESAVEELVRYDSPLQGLLRVATEDVELGGKRIGRGETVLVWLAAANRDPAQFPEPDRLDVARKINRHVAFGHGIHHCLGASLGLLTVETAIRTLLLRAPPLRLASGVIEWQGNFLFRSQRSLQVLF